MANRERVKRTHHFLFWFLGVIFGFMLTIGAILGGAYYIFAYVNVEKVEKTFGVNISNVPDDLKTKTIKDLIPMVSEVSHLTVEEFCDRYDINISFKIQVGTDELGHPLYIDFKKAFKPVMESKITSAFNKIDDVIDYFTVSNTFELLSQVNTLPDFNFLHDVKYKDKPIQDMLSVIDDLTIADLMETTVDLSNGFFSKIKDIKLLELASDGGLNDVINEIQIGDIIEISEDDTGIMGELKDLTIGEISDASIINAIGDLTLQQVLNISDDVSGVISKLKDITINEIRNGDLEDKIEELKLSDILSLDGTNKIFGCISDLTLGEMTDENIIDAISELKVQDIIGTTANTTKLWAVIGNAEIGSISTTIENLSLSQVVEFNKDSNNDGINDAYTGLLAYLIDTNNNKDPKVSELSTEITNTMNDLIDNKTIENLVDNGILDSSYATSVHYNDIKGYSVATLLEKVLDGSIADIYTI